MQNAKLMGKLCRNSFHTLFFQIGFLDVSVPPDFVPEETSGDVMVPEGGNVKLTCRARGHPEPYVQWRREDGNDIIIKEPGEQRTPGLNVDIISNYLRHVIMPRSKSGVTRQGPSNVQVKKALAAVKDGMSQRKACEEFSVSRATLQRLLKRNETEVDNYKRYKNCAVKKKISNQEEESLVKYFLTSSKCTTVSTEIS
ncbi:hypothetical protein JTB14_003486 [Gonioctena quinquepunctata]|nr:hypothetical protein JTB14_003486 [Gonioctena quinquepunctata]